MDYNQYTPNEPRKLSGFSIASMICGIASLVCCCAGLGLPLGALAILFAVLTRRKGQDMTSMTISGMVTGICGVVIGLFFAVCSLVIYEDPYFQRGMYDTFEETYGEDYADIISELYGFDLDEIKGLDVDEWD